MVLSVVLFAGAERGAGGNFGDTPGLNGDEAACTSSARRQCDEQQLGGGEGGWPAF
jgi:hypothetical protein